MRSDNTNGPLPWRIPIIQPGHRVRIDGPTCSFRYWLSR